MANLTAAQTEPSDLARTEPFTTSVMDGIDIRDTLRHWYEIGRASCRERVFAVV